MNREIFDLLVIGGGINGVGIAADAAGRGLKVALCEKDDLASATSSCSSKMIHGGLRYLENLEFRLVREALHEREILLRIAPHLIHPLCLIMPHDAHLRPYWLIRLGLYLYDHLGGKQSLPKCQAIHFNTQTNSILSADFKKGFIYFDAGVDDSRLVITNALSAQAKGAKILTRHRVISAKREGKLWELQILNHKTDANITLYAKALVNAAGPWIDQVSQQVLQIPASENIRLVKGSHILVPKLYNENQAYLLQNKDKRVVFVLPFQSEFTLIGTTDIDYHGDPGIAKISIEEQNYLCAAINHYFKKSIHPKEIVWSFAGVRPLLYDEHQDPSRATRDYSFAIDDKNGSAPALSIYGGKITTYRSLSEHALEKLRPYFPNMGKSWTATAALPGGEFSNYDQFFAELSNKYPWIPTPMLNRLAEAYGTRCYRILNQACAMHDLGEYFGGTLYEREVRYLINEEWAGSIEDILWRRTKQGLFLNETQIRHFSQWLHKEHIT